MFENKNTKRALALSILAIMLCIGMLIGSTFAWFTDNSAVRLNAVKSGKLEVGFMMQDSEGAWVDAEGATLSFKKAASAPAGEKILWEPGATYELPAVKIVNKGNLALKYALRISGIQGDTELAQVLDVKVNGSFLTKTVGGNTTNVTLAELMADPDGAAYGIILAAGKSIAADAPAAEAAITDIGETEALTIAFQMKESANNDYQGLEFTDMSVTVYASQYTFEYDSTTNQYDTDAE